MVVGRGSHPTSKSGHTNDRWMVVLSAYPRESLVSSASSDRVLPLFVAGATPRSPSANSVASDSYAPWQAGQAWRNHRGTGAFGVVGMGPDYDAATRCGHRSYRPQACFGAALRRAVLLKVGEVGDPCRERGHEDPVARPGSFALMHSQ